MLIPFESYGGTYILKSSLICVAQQENPQLVLRDELGYYGFITERAQLEALRDWLTIALR